MNYFTKYHICAGWWKFEGYILHTKWADWEINYCAGRVEGNAIRYIDIPLWLLLPGGLHRIHEAVAENVFDNNAASNSLSQLLFIYWKSQIFPVHVNVIKIYNRELTKSNTQGRGSLVGIARQTAGVFHMGVNWVSVKVAGKWYQVSGLEFQITSRPSRLCWRSSTHGWLFGRSFGPYPTYTLFTG